MASKIEKPIRYQTDERVFRALIVRRQHGMCGASTVSSAPYLSERRWRHDRKCGIAFGKVFSLGARQAWPSLLVRRDLLCVESIIQHSLCAAV